jgi:MFS family permease
MYAIEWSTLLTRTHRNCSACAACPHTAAPAARAAGRRLPVVSPTVWALGATSMLTDISSEMVASILPVYLVLHLGMSPLAFGLVDGLFQGAAALVRVAAGLLADRWRRHKQIALAGYALSAACRLLILLAASAWGMIAAIVAIDRLGKGIRTAPRDALIAQRSPCRELATAFGVHRSMDAAGAMLGPIVAFALLAAMPRGFDVLFIASFGIAIVGVAALVLFVPSTLPSERSVPGTPVSLRTAWRLLDARPFRGMVIAAALLGIATISDAFIFLVLQRRLGIGMTAFPLLYVATSLVMSACALPLGRLADRVGRHAVLIGGYVALLVVYGVLLLPASGGLALAAVAIALLGAYYAATDGVLTAMAAATLPRSHSGSGLALLATATNFSRLCASIVFGWLWSTAGVTSATLTYAGLLAAAIVGASLVLIRSQQDAVDAAPQPSATA